MTFRDFVQTAGHEYLSHVERPGMGMCAVECSRPGAGNCVELHQVWEPVFLCLDITGIVP